MPYTKLILNEVREEVREKLQWAVEALSMEGLPRPALDGKVLRPLAAYSLVPPEHRAFLDDRFWYGALAIEMVHEASLLHDDILDEAPQRRGKPTMAASAGVGPALVMGDHLLTAAYRAAAATGSPEFLDIFIRSVERTVAGEIAQEKSQGRILEPLEYREIITGKSGELFRCGFVLAHAFTDIGSSEALGALGARFGALYQMVDDFLDYCTEADRGKEPLQDYRQRKWTWPLDLIGTADFEAAADDVRTRLFGRDREDSSPMVRGARRMERDFEGLIQALSAEGVETTELAELLQSWSHLILRASQQEVEALCGPAPVPGLAAFKRELRESGEELQSPEDRLRYFGYHARSFRFAARLFPREQLQKVADVYAFCRFTDDLVDEAGDEETGTTEARLNLWLELSRKAYHAQPSGIRFLDQVMGDMRASGVPFVYAEELIEGVRMDLFPIRFRTLEDLRIYSYRVASVVGGWLTELFGIQDPWVLDRAFALGHAMQLTNILRDVGEDLRAGRIYLPEDLMTRFGVDRELLVSKEKNRSPIFPGYIKLLDHLMAEAEADYKIAFEAIPSLPSFFQGPVAVAAGVYRGIHQEIRKNGYDNLRRRASTSLPRKVLLAAQGLSALRRASRVPSPQEIHSRLIRPDFGGAEERRAVS